MKPSGSFAEVITLAMTSEQACDFGVHVDTTKENLAALSVCWLSMPT